MSIIHVGNVSTCLNSDGKETSKMGHTGDTVEKGELVALGPERARRAGSCEHLRDASCIMWEAEGKGQFPVRE